MVSKIIAGWECGGVLCIHITVLQTPVHHCNLKICLQKLHGEHDAIFRAPYITATCFFLRVQGFKTVLEHSANGVNHTEHESLKRDEIPACKDFITVTYDHIKGTNKPCILLDVVNFLIHTLK